MQKFKISLLILLLAIIVVPSVSSAYFTTAQSAIKLNEDTLLYTVTFKFGFPSSDLRMPIGAVRGLQFGDASPYVGYTLLKDSETAVASGTAAGLVLSKAKIVDNEYFVPKGEVGTFTLVALVKVTDDFVPTDAKDYDLSIQVTSLPFTMIKGKSVVKAQLNPSELQYYITPELDLK